MRRGSGRLAFALLVALLACRSPAAPLEVVDEIDLERYLGRWYEIASFPQRFQAGCVATSATYSRRDDGRIRVENACREGRFDGDLRRAEGVAQVADPAGSQAKLKVQFFWPFYGDYWVIELDPAYRWAVVGHPSRDYLWILARERSIEPALYEDLLGRIASHGYDVSRLRRTPQPPGPWPRLPTGIRCKTARPDGSMCSSSAADSRAWPRRSSSDPIAAA